MSEWIKCSERLPEKSCEVIAMTKAHGVVCAYFDSWTKTYKNKSVSVYAPKKQAFFTHWMPLPPAPEEE